MGFSIPTAARISLQGESKRVVRWDLMRPEMFPKQPRPVREPEPPRLDWKERALAELPKEVSDLAICKGRWWKNKTLATLRSDYVEGRQVASQAPAFVKQRARWIAEEYGVPALLLFGKTKVAKVVLARQDLCFELRHYKLPNGRHPALSKIAKWVGLRDHTSAWHSINVVQSRRSAR
jgi:hypothetical protein